MAISSIESFKRPHFEITTVLGILGSFIFFLGFALVTPAFIALIYDEEIWNTFMFFVLKENFAFVRDFL